MGPVSTSPRKAYAMAPNSPAFFDPKLLDTEYLRRHREVYEKYFDEGLISRYRCYPVIVEDLQAIYEYNQQHGKYFARRMKDQQNDLTSCDAVVAEAIVYSHYIPLIKQGSVTALDVKENDYDLKIDRPGSDAAYLEVLTVKPDPYKDENGVYSVTSHTQTAKSSIRQKLLRKLQKQMQMRAARENWAVIELNDMTIAGDFTVPASLSSGYKLRIGMQTMQTTEGGFDWSKSIFDAPETQNLHGVIYFSLGYYQERRYILNPRTTSTVENSVP